MLNPASSANNKDVMQPKPKGKGCSAKANFYLMCPACTRSLISCLLARCLACVFMSLGTLVTLTAHSFTAARFGGGKASLTSPSGLDQDQHANGHNSHENGEREVCTHQSVLS